MGDGLFLGSLHGSEVPDDRRQYLSLSDEDRTLGMHVMGSPGSGKSKFLEHMIRQDIRAGRGLCLIDPHGELYDNIMEWCAYHRIDREIIPLNPSRGDHVVGFNPFLRGSGDIAVQADRCMEAALKAWATDNTDKSPRIDRVLGALFTALVEANDLTLYESDYFVEFNKDQVRNYLVSRIQNDDARGNWLDLSKLKTFDQFNGQVESSRSRLGRFRRAKVVRRFFALTDPKMNLDLKAVMDRGAIVLVNLKWSQNLTKANARLFGALLVNAFITAALQRDVGAGKNPRPFYLYLDEFQNFVTSDIGEAVTQVRKFGLRFVLAHQLLKQLRNPDADVLDEVITAVKARAIFGGLKWTDAHELVPDIFPGQINFDEVKRIDYTVKFWPVYDREKAYSEMRGHTEADGFGGGDSQMGSSMISSGQQWLPGEGFFGGEVAGAHMSTLANGTGYGHVENWSSMSADTFASGVVDLPIYRPIPQLEEKETPWSLEEQKHRLADALVLQYMRHCFMKSPNGPARALLVPFVERFPVLEKERLAYEAAMAKRAGAISPEEVDVIIEERRRQIEYQAREFAEHAGNAVHSTDNEPKRSTTRGRSPKPTPHLRPAKK